MKYVLAASVLGNVALIALVLSGLDKGVELASVTKKTTATKTKVTKTKSGLTAIDHDVLVVLAELEAEHLDYEDSNYAMSLVDYNPLLQALQATDSLDRVRDGLLETYGEPARQSPILHRIFYPLHRQYPQLDSTKQISFARLRLEKNIAMRAAKLPRQRESLDAEYNAIYLDTWRFSVQSNTRGTSTWSHLLRTCSAALAWT